VALGVAGLALRSGRDRRMGIVALGSGARAGARLIDTARAYSPTKNGSYGESLAADAARGLPVLIATKVGHSRTGPDSWGIDVSPARLRAMCTTAL